VPPGEHEAAVAATRAAPAHVGLEKHNGKGGLLLLEADRRPETAVAATADTDVRIYIALKRRRVLLAGERSWLALLADEGRVLREALLG
jgi:hypothetical protein